MTLSSRLYIGASALALAFAGTACSSDSTAPVTETEYMGLKMPSQGFQVRSQGATVDPGEDVEYCEVAELPGTPEDTYFVNGVELANGKGSHHLILEYADPGSPADEKLRAMQIGERVPCVAASIAFGDGVHMISGIQHPYGRHSFPPGIAQKLVGGQRIVFDYHYYNTGEDPVEARSAMNVHLMDEGDVDQLTTVFGFFNFTIDTPPNQTASFTGDCRFGHDTMVGTLVRHTHQWGRDFSAWFAGGSRDGERIWSTPDYETDTNHVFDEPVRLNAGEGFRFRCTFENPESHALRFGPNASDEMCILFGYYWDGGGAYEPRRDGCEIGYVAEDGVGYPPSHPQAFPPAPPEEAALCLSLAPEKNACTECSCGACAGTLGKCMADEGCAAILGCTAGGGDCKSVIDEHSSATGLAKQVQLCVGSKCAAECF